MLFKFLKSNDYFTFKIQNYLKLKSSYSIILILILKYLGIFYARNKFGKNMILIYFCSIMFLVMNLFFDFSNKK